VLFPLPLSPSREIISEIQVVLVGLYGEEFASFFLKEEVVVWLDQMLESLRNLKD